MPFLEPQPSLRLYFSITEPETRKSRLISEGTDLQRRRELVTYDAGIPLDVLFARKLERIGNSYIQYLSSEHDTKILYPGGLENESSNGYTQLDETEKKAVQFAFAGILFGAGIDAMYRTLTMPYAQEGPLFFDIDNFQRKIELATDGLGYRDMHVRATSTAPCDPHTKAEVISSTDADELREYVRTHHTYDFLFTDFTSHLPTALVNAFRSKPYLTELLLPYPYQRRKPEDRTIQELFHERAVVLIDTEDNPTTPTPLDDEGVSNDTSTPLPPWMNNIKINFGEE